LASDLLDRLLGLALRRGPLAATQRGERRRCAADVPRDAIDALGRERDDVGARERELEILAHDAGDLLRDEPLEPRDAVLLVHHVIAGLEIGQEGAESDALATALRMARL